MPPCGLHRPRRRAFVLSDAWQTEIPAKDSLVRYMMDTTIDMLPGAESNLGLTKAASLAASAANGAANKGKSGGCKPK